MDPSEFVRRVNEQSPAGVRLLAATAVERNSPSLTSRVAAARYRVGLGRLGLDPDEVRARVEELLAATEWVVEKRVKKKRGDKITRFDLRVLVRELRVVENGELALETCLGRREGNLGRPKELLVALFGLDRDRVLDAQVHKVDSYVEFDGELVSMGAGWSQAERFDPYSGARRRGHRTPEGQAVPA